MLLIIAAVLVPVSTGQFSCKNREGKNVDWFVGYKLPKAQPTLYPGVTFLYADEHSTSWGPPENLSSPQSAIVATLSQYYRNQNDKTTFYLLYNDEKPNSKEASSNRAHAKGVAVFGNSTGFWFIHSVPKFPPQKRYSYISSGERFGQSFLCITMNTTSIQVYAEAMMYMYPAVYSSQIPKHFIARFPFLELLKSRKKFGSDTVRDSSHVQKFQSAGGQDFTCFAKSRKYGKDLYSDLIAPHMKTSLYVETWLYGNNDFPSICDTQYKVINVNKLNVTSEPFLNNHDHSKWAVGEESNKPFVCVGDINRQQSQTKRGGGAVCFKSLNIWNLYRSSILEVEKCKES